MALHYWHSNAAISLTLAVAPLATLGVLFLPEPARRTLEEIAEEAS